MVSPPQESLLDLTSPPTHGFTPAPPLITTPIQDPETTKGEKRTLTSPEEVQEAVRRRVMARRKDVPPIGGLLLSASPPATATHSAPPPAPVPRDFDKAEELTSATVERLAGLATASTQRGNGHTTRVTSRQHSPWVYSHLVKLIEGTKRS
uniref:Uncharacterized protein n=1 Tax=Heliothis virescens TaxID=7102 RepID=A0A2A4JB50_HELVI